MVASITAAFRLLVMEVSNVAVITRPELLVVETVFGADEIGTWSVCVSFAAEGNGSAAMSLSDASTLAARVT